MKIALGKVDYFIEMSLGIIKHHATFRYVDKQQTKEPYALSSIGWFVNPWLSVPLSHKAQAGYDWSRAIQREKNTGSQGATGQPPLRRAEISFVYFHH